MKLRNKKTGEIGYLRSTNWNEKALIIMDLNGVQLAKYNSISELNEDWEDYEEPKELKEHYFIAEYGSVYPMSAYEDYNNVEDFDDYKQIGNYFDSREEAEKAVEKLKAWKRLKDKGFRFTGVAGISNNIHVSFETDSKYSGGHIMYDEYSNTDNKLKEYNEDLKLLFGGEE